ncbi:MAG: hypothetical protein AABY03_01235 [Nanoarchaeota archaeon]
MKFKRNLVVIAASVILTACVASQQQNLQPVEKVIALDNATKETRIEKTISLRYTMDKESEKIMSRAFELQQMSGYVEADINGDGEIDSGEARDYNQKLADAFRRKVGEKGYSGNIPTYSISQ